MAPSSLKKMRGSRGRKEGNYASSDGSTSLDVFTSDNLGLTLLPGSQIQKKDERETIQAAISRPRKISTTEQQGDGQLCLLELEKNCQTATRGSTVDESIGGSCYFGLRTGAERYSNTGYYDDEAVIRPEECCAGIQGNHDLKRNEFSLLTGTVSRDIGNGLYHDRKADTRYSRALYHSSLAKEKRDIERDIPFNSSNQMIEEEVRGIDLNGARSSLDSVVGNEHDCGRNNDTKACENSLEHNFCGSKGKKSENLLLTSSSGLFIDGLAFNKLIKDNSFSKGCPLTLSTGSAQERYNSTRISESEITCSVITETNNHSYVASTLPSPVELQGSCKAIPTAHQQAPNSLHLSPQLIPKPPQASLNLHAAPPKRASGSVKHLKRSWTRHFPTSFTDLPLRGRYSDHAHTSSATPSCSIASQRDSNSLKLCFARENRCKIVTHLNSGVLPVAPPESLKPSRASYNLERDILDNIKNTRIDKSRLKTGIKRSKSLPDLCHLHQSSNMYPQQGHQSYQVPTPPMENHAVGNNAQNSGPGYNPLPANHADSSVPWNSHGNIDTPLTGRAYQNMHANVRQPDQSLPNANTGASVHGYRRVQYSIQGSNQTQVNYPLSTNDGLVNSNGNRFYTPTEHMTLNEKFANLSWCFENNAKALQSAREQDQISKAKIKELERAIEAMRQQLKSVGTANVNSSKDRVKVKSSGNRGVARTVDWARQSHPTAGVKSPNAGSASSENKSIQSRDGNDGLSMKSGAGILTMVSPTQRQHASVPAPAMECPSTQAEHVQAPCSGPFQPEAQFLPDPLNPAYSTSPLNPAYSPSPLNPAYSPSPYNPADPLNPYNSAYSPNPYNSAYSPNPYTLGQYSANGSQPVHSFQNQANQFQQGPGDDFVGFDQQSPRLSASHTLPAAAQAEASMSGIKRKREAEPDAAQGVKRQQQPVEAQPELSPEQAANDDQARDEAWKNMSQKDYAWYDGVNPFTQTSKEGKQFGIPSASLPQATPHPALAPQAPKELIAPTPDKACRKTTKKIRTKRGMPKSDAEMKLRRAGYNKTYKEKKKKTAKEGIEKKAAEKLEASETTLPIPSADNDDGPHQGRPVDSSQEDVNEQYSDPNDDDLDEDSASKEPHGDDEESDNKNSDTDGLSAAEQALVAELEDAMMMEDDDPLGQAVDDATDRTINEIIDGEEDEDEESEESEEE